MLRWRPTISGIEASLSQRFETFMMASAEGHKVIDPARIERHLCVRKVLSDPGLAPVVVPLTAVVGDQFLGFVEAGYRRDAVINWQFQATTGLIQPGLHISGFGIGK
jgi:hypothetical protein